MEGNVNGSGVGSLGGYSQAQSAGAVPTVVGRIQDEQAKALADLEMKIKALAEKLQPFIYDGPRNESGPIANTSGQGIAPPPPVLSQHLNAIAGNTSKIVMLALRLWTSCVTATIMF
jgi:hypothetical protein